MCFGLHPHANTVFGLKVTFGKHLPFFHWCAEFLARDVRDCGLTFLFTWIKKGHLHLFTHEVFFPIDSHWPKFGAHKLWGRDSWWGLEPAQVEHARPRAKYKLKLTLGWVCWLWKAGLFFFFSFNSPNSKISKKKISNLWDLHSEDFFPHLLKWGSQNCVLTALQFFFLFSLSCRQTDFCAWRFTNPNTFTCGLRLELDLKSICSID